MIDFLDSISTFLSQWLLDAAGWYGLLFVIISRLRKQWLKPIPDTAVLKLISLAGLVLTLNIILTTILYFILPHSKDDLYLFTNRIFGPYWMYFWYQILVWIICPQLFRLKPFKNKAILRLAASLPLAISLEEYIRCMVSFQRDFTHGLFRFLSIKSALEIVFEAVALVLLAWGYEKLKAYLKIKKT